MKIDNLQLLTNCVYSSKGKLVANNGNLLRILSCHIRCRLRRFNHLRRNL
jgi:hypothetical protein